MNYEQRAQHFYCNGSSLVGIVDVPERPLPRGLLVLADGAQYRTGAHRQFTLLSRMLAARGIPVMRFDRRGMGDSEGAPRACQELEDDIRAAMKDYFIQVPEMKEIVILGLGDAAVAAALFAPSDERVRGLVLLNPSLRHAAGEVAPNGGAGEPGPGVRFWKQVATGKVDLAAGAAALRQNLRLVAPSPQPALAQRLAESLLAFRGQVLAVLGGADPDAAQFARLLDRHRLRCRRVEIAGADHGFARREWRDEVATVSANWIMSW